MPHQRSKQAEERRLQRRNVRRFVLRYSFRDRERAETICVFNQDDVMTRVSINFPDLADVEKGEVLVDSRGWGSFQRVTK